MPVTSGIHHVAVVTSDLDRLIDFYVSVFEAEVIEDMDEGALRHALIDLGGGTALHPFYLGSNPHALAQSPMFNRGHVDHVALKVDDPAHLETLRQRLVEIGASDGQITDFGNVRTVTFVDPDGWEGEVAHWQDAAPRSFQNRIQEPYPHNAQG